MENHKTVRIVFNALNIDYCRTINRKIRSGGTILSLIQK